MGETAEELKLRLTMDIQQAISTAKTFRSEVEAVKSSIRSVATEAKVSFKDAAESMINQFSKEKRANFTPLGNPDQVKAQMRKINAEISNYSKAVRTAAREMQAASGVGKDLGRVFSAVTAGFGLYTGWQMLTNLIRGVINALKEATKAAYDFSKSIFALQAGINAMRRAGVDITFKDMMDNIKKLRTEFKQFSTVELVQGSAELINLSRDFGATKEQIFELQDAIIKLAIINGRAMDDVQRTVALALSSGYTEGLQRLGVSINRVTIAEEAQRLGFGRNYLALTEQQRYLATQNILLAKTAKYQDDLNKYMETTPGTIDAASAAWKDLGVVMGTYLLPVWGIFMSVVGRVLNFMNRALKEAIPSIFANFVRPFATMASAASQLWEILLGKRAIQDFDMSEVNEKVSKATRNLAKGIREDIANASMELSQAEIEMPIKEMSIDDAKTYQDFFRELYDMQDASEGKLKELAYKFGEDMLEIDADWQQESKEAWADYQKELAEIAQKEKDDIAEAEKDLAKDIADLNKDTQRDEADAARKYRENELKAERDYQEKLRRLKEEFLYDLEDALRERDALQVLRLIRRYKLDVEQLQRQNEEEQQERQDSYRQELEDIRRQKEEKLQELQEEHAERLAEIREQAEKEREEAANSYAEKIAELNAQYTQERADRQAQYEQDKQDLIDALDAQVKSVIQKFIEMNNLTGDQVALLSATLKNVFGVGGVAEGAFSEFGLNLQNLTLLAEVEVNKIRGYLEGLAADIEMIGLYSAALPTTTPGNPLDVAGGANLPSSVPGYASGVQNMLLTRPHLFMAGEVPEVMNITPVSQLASGKSGGSGKGTLEISLSEGLVGTIIDNTLGEVAIVMKDRLR